MEFESGRTPKRAPMVLRAGLVAFSVFAAVTIAPATPVAASCPVPTSLPTGCSATTLLDPPDLAGGVPQNLVVDSLMCVRACGETQPYVFDHVTLVDGGTLLFIDPPAGAEQTVIDFRISSLLIQQGGTLTAGSSSAPFGANGGHLKIGLWGDDPTNQGKTTSTAAIHCKVPKTGSDGMTSYVDGPCFPAELTASPHYCTGGDPSDPCNDTTKPTPVGDNARFEGYGDLPYDNPQGHDDAGVFFGYKVLAVSYGGSLELFGAKGVAGPDDSADSCTAPTDPTVVEQWAALSNSSWARLDAHAKPQDTVLVLDRAVDWAAGDSLVVATTDWHPSNSEEVKISTVSADGKTITLDSGLATGHFGTIYQVPKDQLDDLALYHSDPGHQPPNTAVETRAAVGLLSRSITIESLGKTHSDPFPSASACGSDSVQAGDPMGCYFGGHVIARQGFGRFQMQGVELKHLGQGGRMGHYPAHFHMAKSTAYTDAFVLDSSVWNSNTRFIVLHGAHDVRLERNVGFRSVGHGFYLEDGSEINNLLCSNLGVSARAANQQYYDAQAKVSSDGEDRRYIPPILERTCKTVTCAKDGEKSPRSDSLGPVMYWSMNQYNEFVGNMAAGVHGSGSCYWLLGASVSGLSASPMIHWTTDSNSEQDYADFNRAGARQAPLKRFRGNICTTATYGLQTSLDVFPATLSQAERKLTPVANPYDQSQILFPVVDGNFTPVRFGPDPDKLSCDQALPAGTAQRPWQNNTERCVTTILDRFTTSFNWSEVNFGAVWLRPQWFVFINSAITDQLSGGLGFVGGGNWSQVPPGFFDLAKDSIFAGTTRDAANPATPEDDPKGPAITENCINGCLLPEDGTVLFPGGFQPKRLMTIYDGPFYAEGSIFTNTPEEVCDPTVTTTRPCGFYKTTRQPADNETNLDMLVANGGIGWKQPNGFYYPPAFAFLRSVFDQQTQRHYVIDQYHRYLNGAQDFTGQPAPVDPLFPNTQSSDVTTIDFSTILNDMDGTLTGWAVEDSSGSQRSRTSSVSRNRFFDAPAQADECLSFGVQTSAYDFSTTVMSKLKDKPAFASPWFMDFCASEAECESSGAWNKRLNEPDKGDPGAIPGVPIYRQLYLTDRDDVDCTTVCDSTKADKVCSRASFMAGTTTGSAPYLTVNNGTFYIDTDTAHQDASCIANTSFALPGFAPSSTYVLWQIFPNQETKNTYQIYVGPSFDPSTQGSFVRVSPHRFSGNGNSSLVEAFPDYPGPVATVQNGVLTVTFEYTQMDQEFLIENRDQDERCMPRDMCQYSSGEKLCTLTQDPDRLAALDPQLHDTIDQVCRIWGTATSGVLTYDAPSISDPATKVTQQISFTECPSEGCVGYVFQLPSDFVSFAYAEVGNIDVASDPAKGLKECFPKDAVWQRSFRSIDPHCPAPSEAPSGFCAATTALPTASTGVKLIGKEKNVDPTTLPEVKDR